MVIHWAMVMLCWLLGVALQLQQSEASQAGWSVAALSSGALIAGLLWWLSARRKRRGRFASKRWLVWCLVAALLGWGQAQWRATERLQETWPEALTDEAVELTGRIDAMPQPRTWGTGLEVQVLEVAYQGRRWRAGQRWALPGLSAAAVCPGRVSLSWSAGQPKSQHARPLKAVSVPVLLPGQVWRWRAQLHVGRGQSNPGGFDSELWMFERGLRVQGKVDTHASGDDGSSQSAPVLIHEIGWTSPGWIDRWRTHLRDRVLAHVHDDRVAGLVIGLTVGDQSAIHQDDWLVLRKTGVAHLASISGLHITMMGWMIAALAAMLWRRSFSLMHWVPVPTASAWVGLLGAWLYALIAGWGVPAQRTVLMLGMVTLLRSGGRRWPWALVLLAAALAVTLLDPWSLTQAGFWLSFAAVALLTLAGGDLMMVQQASWWGQLRQVAAELLRTQSIASFGLAPLSLVFFQAVSVVSLLANLVCIPLFTLLITPLALAGFAWPALWQVLEPLVQGTMAGLSWLADSPWSVVQGAAVSFWAASVGLLAGAWLLAPVPWRWKLVALPAMLPLLWPTSMSQILSGPPEGELQVMAVDIGQGTAVLVRTARHALLYDTGPRLSPETDAGQRVLVGLLAAVGVRQLDEMMISHGDMDHIGGAASVLRAVPVARLRTSLAADHELLHTPVPHGSPPPHTPCQAGQRWVWEGVHFEVLHPTEDDLAAREHLSDNAVSCVLRIEAHGRRVLLTGDIEADQEAALLSRDPEVLASEVLVVPHHGSKTSSTPAFLRAVHPQVAVIQAGARNRYGHPHASVVERYRFLGITLEMTPDCGAWVWQSNAAPSATAAGWCWRDRSPRYWQGHHAPASPKPSV